MKLSLTRHVLHFEARIEDAIRSFAATLPDEALVLDAGAGESPYSALFPRHRVVAIDLAIGDPTWNYASLDAQADLEALPFADAVFDAALCIVTLEHVPDPARVLAEIARTLRPGAPLLVVVPFFWEVHQAPHDYWRFTCHGMELLLRRAGFTDPRIDPAGGYFRLLARTLANGIKFFAAGWKWLLFPFAALLLGPPALLAPLLDRLDTKRDLTLGYICLARRNSPAS